MIGLVLALQVALAADEIERWDLEADDGSLVPAGEIDAWEWGDVESGPGAGFDGSRAWGTNLSGTYGNDSIERLTLPVRDLAEIGEPAFCWMQWLDLEQGDAGWIEWSDGVDTAVMEPIYGYPSGGVYEGFTGTWDQVCLDLTGAGDLGQVRLVFSADAKVSATGWYVDALSLLDGDPVGPLLSDLSVLPDTEDLDGPYVVEVTAIDNRALGLVRLGWRVDGVDQAALSMVGTDVPDVWRGELPGQSAGVTVEYWVDASDGGLDDGGLDDGSAEDGSNWTRAPASGSHGFDVALPTPTDLTGPEGRVVAIDAELSWSAPASIHALQGYRVYRQDALVVETDTTSVTVSLLGEGADTFAVAALYDVGESAPGDPLTLDSHVPTVLSLLPVEAYQGDTIRLDLLGQDLFFVQGDLVVDLGAGVAVTEVDVFDVDSARLVISVDAGADAGARELALVSGDVFLSLPDAFEVVDGAQRPQLVSVAPDFVTQGTETDLTVIASAGFASLPTVDLGEGVVVSDVAWLDDDELRVRVVVELDAPLGLHALEVDDTERIWEGLQLQVRDDPPATTRCSTVPSDAAWGLVWLAGLAGLARRRA